MKRKTVYDYYIPSGTDYAVPLSTVTWPSGGPRRLNAVKRVTVYEGSSTAKAATEFVYDYPYTKGNVTYGRHWDSVKAVSLPALGNLTSSNSQEFNYVYDGYGNVTDIYEPSVSTSNSDRPRTHITYDSTGSHVVKVETGYGTNEKRTVQYDWTPNKVALWKKIDVDNSMATVYTYDNAGRVIAEVYNNLRGTWTEYDDVNRKVLVKSDLFSLNDKLLQTRTHYDQLGRVSYIQTRKHKLHFSIFRPALNFR